jgi:adenylate cyclase
MRRWLDGSTSRMTLDEQEDEALRRRTLLLSVGIITPLASVWTVTYWLLGLPRAAAIPLGYQVVSGLSLLHFARTRRYRFFRASQLLLMLLLPFLLAWSLGGFVASSGVMLWALVSPLGALMFQGARPAVYWLGAFLVLTVVSGFLEGVLASQATAIPESVIVAFFVMNFCAVSGVSYALLHYFVRQRERAMDALRVEREKSERLLLNVLPQPIANRLKTQEGIIADGHSDVTVLFADIVDFTPLSERLVPEQVVALLDEIFTAFDALADEQGLEKIKTIGDAYMVAGGLPVPRRDHVQAVAEMALGMLEAVARCAERFHAPLSVRIGIDTGPVVAGVIGRRKFIYDLWGDTVNTASRMESHGVPGAIQATRAVYERLSDRYEFEERGSVSVKGKGAMTTYLLLGRKPAPLIPDQERAG